MVISSMTLDLMEISILMVGEILAILPSSKALGAGIGFLNQSICPGGRKSLVSTVYMGFWWGGMTTYYEGKSALWWSMSHGKSGLVNSSRMSSSQ
jgi:hypothetical protein